MNTSRNWSWFPKDPEFWAHHIGGMATVILTQFMVGYVVSDNWSDHLDFEILALSCWVLGFTVMMLVYRSRYHEQSWSKLSLIKLLSKSLSLLVVLALVSVVCMLAISLPGYWETFYQEKLETTPEITEARYLFAIVVTNWATTSAMGVSWAFLYIGITNQRRVKQSEMDNLRLQNSLKEAQLSSLSNQLNPHFLFNSLNNIRFMIHENADQADETITALSEILRYSLESSQYERLPLAKEIEIVQRYMDIVRIQFEERLRFEMAVPAELLSVCIPPMLIQILIENAVKHGLEQIKEGGLIQMDAAREGNNIVLEVSNDIPQASFPNTDNTGIGLKNIRQRLQLLYGDRASLAASRNQGKFKVLIHLPAEQSDIQELP
ncbi:MAG: histidine kinase [Pseudomonadota bacterium]